MSERPAGDEQTESRGIPPEHVDLKQGSTVNGRRWLVPVLIVGAVLVALYGFGLRLPHIAGKSAGEPDGKLAPVFSRSSPDDVFSKETLLQGVGKSPVDPSRVLLPVFERPATAGDPGKAKTGPTSSGVPPGSPQGTEAVGQEPGSQVQYSPGEPGETESGPGLPAVVPRAPTGSGPDTAPEEPTPGTDPVQVPQPNQGERDPAASPSPRPGPRAGALEYGGSKAGSATQPPGAVVPTAAPKAPAQPEPGKVEQFQLPGSLVVTIHDYSGTMPKWGLMIVLDDSASMARRVKGWGASRLQTAVSLVEKLPETLPAGSKIAVRDFLCKKSGEDRKSKTGGCPSHTLYPWAEAPFAGLKEKLDAADPGGASNPCAAAVFSMKQDFGGLGGLTPRILIVTDGAGKCSVEQVIRAVDSRGEKEKIGLDVVAVGMARKRVATFGKLAKSTNGFFFTVDKPADIESAVARYGKILKTSIMEKIEVRGHKAVVNISPDQEVTLTPGGYTVVLPTVAGIKPSQRVVENVKVNPGEATLLEVRVKKGRLVTKVGKKP